MKKIIASLLFLLSLSAFAQEKVYKELSVSYSDDVKLVITNEYCKDATSKTTVLYQAYAVDKKSGEVIQRGCFST